MSGIDEVDRAHAVALELFQTIRDYWDLCCDLQSGMPSDDPRLDDITRLRARVRDGLETAESDLVRQLPEFACVHEWPVTVEGFTASSGHQAIIKIAKWLKERPWTTAKFREFFERYFDVATGKVRWTAVVDAGDKTTQDAYDFWCMHDWDELRALLEMEHAKARKLTTSPAAPVSKIRFFEGCILQCVSDEPMTAREIADKAREKNNSHFRTVLRRMVDKGLLKKHEPYGYSKAPAAK